MISMYIFNNEVYKPIDSSFIGYDIARTSAIPTNYVTTDTEQTITGKKVFGTLQAANLSDGTTTKTMTEVISGTTEA